MVAFEKDDCGILAEQNIAARLRDISEAIQVIDDPRIQHDLGNVVTRIQTDYDLLRIYGSQLSPGQREPRVYRLNKIIDLALGVMDNVRRAYHHLTQERPQFESKSAIGVAHTFYNVAELMKMPLKVLHGADTQSLNDYATVLSGSFDIVAINLLSNSRHHGIIHRDDKMIMPAPHLHIVQGCRHISYTYYDYGPGIRDDDNNLVGEIGLGRYLQSGHKGSNSQGSGIGLSNVETFVHASDGKLDLINDEIRGFGINIKLPINI